MKKILLLIYCFFGYLAPAAWACVASGPDHGEYEIQGKYVYYQQNYGNEPMLIKGADATTFLVNTKYSCNDPLKICSGIIT